MDAPHIAVAKVSHAIGKANILRQIDLTIPRHTFTGLIGPNGAGKSTLLRVLNGLRRPQQGRVYVEDRDVHQLSDRERARCMAMMPQQPHVGFGFTVEEVVAMGQYAFTSRFRSLSFRAKHVVQEAMQATNVTHLKDRLITQLSGGEQQRVFLSRALAQQPEIMFLDEPTANLDVRYQLEVFDIITKLQKERNMTVVMAIHDLSWALRYCEHIVVMHKGTVRAAGKTKDVLTEQLIYDVFGVRACIVQTDDVLRLDVLSL